MCIKMLNAESVPQRRCEMEEATTAGRFSVEPFQGSNDAEANPRWRPLRGLTLGWTMCNAFGVNMITLQAKTPYSGLS
jgi:hypothetical protein